MQQQKMNQTARLSQEKWLAEALEALVEEGPRILTVDKICRRLDLSRGSFYWHFKDRDDFIHCLAEFWDRTKTRDIVKAVAAFNGSPEERLLRLMELIQETNAAAYDIAMRAWASHEPKAAEIVERVDRHRYKLVKSLFRDMGFSGDELEMRARTFFVFNSFDPGVTIRESRKQQKARLKLRHEFFVRR